jgi:hypothetical protein
MKKSIFGKGLVVGIMLKYSDHNNISRNIIEETR